MSPPQRRYYPGKRLTELRKAAKLNQLQLAQRIGRRPETVWRWERGGGIKDADCEKIAKALGTTKDELIGAVLPPGAEPPPSRWIKVPRLGHCPASAKRIIHDEVLEWVETPEDLKHRYGRIYFLTVKGDSMNRANIDDGDTILVAADWEPKPGRIVVALVDDECTIKRFSRTDRVITLAPDSNNPKHLPQSYTKANDVMFRGVVVEVWRKQVK